MASVMQILRRIGGTKAPPAAGTAGELALWKAGTAATDDASLYANDGVQWRELLDTAAQWLVNANGIHRATGRVGVGVALPLAEIDVNGVSAHNVATTTGAMDLAVSQMFTATVAGATGWSFTNVPASRGVTVVLHLTNGGSGAQTWPASVKWPGGIAPTLTAAGTDVLVFVTHDGGATWRGNIFGSDIK